MLDNCKHFHPSRWQITTEDTKKLTKVRLVCRCQVMCTTSQSLPSVVTVRRQHPLPSLQRPPVQSHPSRQTMTGWRKQPALQEGKQPALQGRGEKRGSQCMTRPRTRPQPVTGRYFSGIHVTSLDRENECSAPTPQVSVN